MATLVIAGVVASSHVRAESPSQTPGEPSAATAMTRRVDELLHVRLAEERMTPAEDSTDAEFLRRVTIDLTGRVPRVREVQDFLAETRPDRRARLIDQLLARPTHAAHLATTWRRMLVPDNTDFVRAMGDDSIEYWLHQKFVDNVPYDAVVREVVLAKGSLTTGPALFYSALENKPEELAGATSRVFLGVQLQCAQCHDHPHDQWSQEDFWGLAAFFARLEPLDRAQADNVAIADAQVGEVRHPLTNEVVAPRYLKGDVAIAVANQTRREQLAAWITARENPYFARAAVNRAWAMLFGRGLIDPVDDLSEHNPPSHPELLNELAAYFTATNYDLRNLLRVLTNTSAYQRTSKLRDGETPTPPELFARMAIKPLTAEQLYDSLAVATAKRSAPSAMMTEPGVNLDQTRVAFLDKFRSPQEGAAEYQGGIPQALTLMNGPLLGELVDLESSALLNALEAPFFSERQRIETLFLATLARSPSVAEEAKFLSYVESRLTEAERKRARSDVLWALLNSAEFALNH
jgi:hypothetical protein